MTSTQPLPYSLRNDHTSWSIMRGTNVVADRLTMLAAVRLLKIANQHDKAAEVESAASLGIQGKEAYTNGTTIIPHCQ